MKLFKNHLFIPARTILIAVSLVIAFHIVFLAVYTQRHKSTQYLAARDTAIQKVMDVIHLISATPQDDLQSAINSLNFPLMEISLSKTPKWSKQSDNLTFWQINRIIPEHAEEIELSLKVAPNQWLNLKLPIIAATLWSQILLLLLEFIVAAIILFYAWSINRFTKPLKTFQVAAERLGVDIHTTPLSEFHGPLIVRETAQAMNRMQQRIQDLINDRTQMLAAISHDLRTPITRLKLRASMLAEETLQQDIIRDLDEMEAMIAEILDFARGDYTDEKKVKMDLNSLLQSICDEQVDLGHDVNYHCALSRVPYLGRALALKRAFTNVIQNAIKYGQRARVTLARNHKKIIVTIDDDGPGINDAELKQVFTPFYRCEKSRSRDIAGTGLGLTITYNAIVGQGGHIELANRKEGGLRVTITLEDIRHG